MNFSTEKAGKVLGYILGAGIVLAVAVIPIISFEASIGIVLCIFVLWGIVHLAISRERRKGDKGPGSN